MEHRRFDEGDRYASVDDRTVTASFLIMLLLAGAVVAVLTVGLGWGSAAGPPGALTTETSAAALPDSTAPTEPPIAIVSPTVTPTTQTAHLVSTETPTAEATATTETPKYYVVGNTGGVGVALRRTPRMDDRLVAWPDNTRMEVIGPDVQAEGRLWRNVRDPRGNEGFIPAEWLLAVAAAPTEEATPTAYVVGNTGGMGVALRRTPRMDDRLIAWPDNTRMEVIGPDVEAEGRLWRNVRDPRGNEGFIPAEWLIPAA